jgi:thioredoxin
LRHFALALIVLSLAVVGCGGPKKEEAPAATDTTAITQPADTAAMAADTTAAAPTEQAAEKPAEVKPAAKKDLPKLWDFSAEWCPPCKQLKPVIAQLEEEYKGKVEIRTIDTDKEPDLAKQFGVQAIPTLVYLDASGKELDRSVGLVEKSAIIGKFQSLGFIQ